jgi:hypothetical protein
MTIAIQPHATEARSDVLNRECFCLSLDRSALHRALESELGSPGLSTLVAERCPFVFSSYPVFVSAHHIERMTEVIRAVESVIALPAWKERVLANAPMTARHASGTKGVFLGYDFHLNSGTLGLIEINTNAGGAMLNAVLAKAQRACCPEVAAMVPTSGDLNALEQGIVAMFANEWRLSGRERPMRVIALVDEAPMQQYLYPEFLLFQRLLERHGYKVFITSPKACEFHDGALWHENVQIDLVYNRLTDFMLEDASARGLREAYLEDAVVLTPNPRDHALYANKRNLALLTDSAELAAMGVAPNVRDTLLAGIPHTEIVDASQAERLWSERRKLFFKPASGFGSRGAYNPRKKKKRVL